MAATLRDLLTGRPHMCGPDTTLLEAAEAMAAEGHGSLGVIDGRSLVGVLTERDLVRAMAAHAELGATLVEAYMSRDPDTFPADTSVEEAASWIGEYGYRHLPVTEDNELLGIVSVRDLLKALMSSQ